MKTRNEKELIKLIKDGCDGGNGEFDKFMPSELVNLCVQKDLTFFPEVVNEKIVWYQIG